MIRGVLLLACAWPLLAVAPSTEPPPKDPALRKTLLAMGRDDQARPEIPGTYERNGKLIREIVAEHGWPGKTLVGPDAAHAAWVVVQHQDMDVAFQRRCLELMRLAFETGEVTADDLAYLTDRVHSNEGKPQMNGTQGVGVLNPEDEARIDRNRFALGLPPWREFIGWKRDHPGPIVFPLD